MPHKIPLKERVLGCVLGGAVGDALGAPFEGLWSRSIPSPAALLAAYDVFEGYPRGQYTDDTQLTIATLRSVIHQGQVDPAHIARLISRLWRSQEVVGPGGACTAAADRLLAGGHWTECGSPIGQAGNGTAMRTAALGLYYLSNPAELPKAVADVSRITHQDPRSVAGGVAIASAARLFATSPEVDAVELCRVLADDCRPYHPHFADLIEGLPAYLTADKSKTLDYLAWSGSPSSEFDEPIITPYVVPTVLASLWAVMSFPTSWPDAVSAVIGLGGDVDTLGAIVGGLMGARLGNNAIPEHLVATVLHSSRLHDLALRYVQVIMQNAVLEV